MTEKRKAPGAAARPAGGTDAPPWIPAAARDYLAHTEGGRTLRDLAREGAVAPSTILRRVRRVEAARDDPLVDGALRDLSGEGGAGGDVAALGREALPVLRRLVEPRAVLAVASRFDLGVILRESADGEPQRLATVERRLAEAMALRDWIACADPEARVRRYRVTGRGRLVLRRLLAGERAAGLAEAPATFEGADRLRHMRSAMPESPLAALARRRDGDGRPFLDRDLVAAGERLREDFELGEKTGPARDWDAWLADPARAAPEPARPGPGHLARARVDRALLDLGPGLADVALRCCCLLEGLEQVERRLGWSARSGKVVLRIALERLRRHHREAGGPWTPLIG